MEEESGLRWGARMPLLPKPCNLWPQELGNDLDLGQSLLPQRWRRV